MAFHPPTVKASGKQGLHCILGRTNRLSSAGTGGFFLYSIYMKVSGYTRFLPTFLMLFNLSHQTGSFLYEPERTMICSRPSRDKKVKSNQMFMLLETGIC